MTPKSFSLLFGFIFLAAGLLGFINNPVIGESPGAIFHSDLLHNGVHIGSGVLFIFVALLAPRGASTFMAFFGTVYLLIGILGLIDIGTGGMGKVLGILHVNGPDNLLHIGLGIMILVAGLVRRQSAEE